MRCDSGFGGNGNGNARTFLSPFSSTPAQPHPNFEDRMKRLAKPAVFVACLLPLAWIGLKFQRDALGVNPIRELEIETGLWTLRLLAVTLAITPARRAFGWNGLAKYRRMLGLFTF